MYSNTAESFKFLIKTSWGNWLRKLFFQTFPEYWRLMGGWTKKTTQNLEHTSFNAHQCLIILSFVILDYTFVLHLVVSLDFAVIHRFCSSCSLLYSSYDSDFSILLVVSSLFFFPWAIFYQKQNVLLFYLIFPPIHSILFLPGPITLDSRIRNFKSNKNSNI